MMSHEPTIKLNEWTADEWYEVYRVFCPDDSIEQFQQAWAEFQERKAKRGVQ